MSEPINFNQLQSHPLAPMFYHLKQTVEGLGGGVEFTEALNEVSKLSDAVEVEINRKTEAERIADAVIAWMVERELLDAGNEYYAADVVASLNDLLPASPTK